MFKKTIIWEFFTTISFKQALYSLYFLTFWIFNLKNWEYNKKFTDLLIKKVFDKNNNNEIFTFYNGRSAIYHALNIIWIDEEDEIIVNSYTCSVVVNSVLQSWWKIVYSDIEKDTLSFDFEKLKTKITNKTKVIILQHTFGKKARDYDKIINFAKENNILIIEDHAHSLWSFKNPKWDFLIFSTWRDKVISSVTWWVLIINNEKYFWKEIKLHNPSIKLILQNLMYNIVWYKAYKLYNIFSLWKITIFLSRKLNLITEILTKKEKQFLKTDFNLKLPNCLAFLAYKDLQNLEKYTEIRLKNTNYYLKNIKNNKIEFIFKDTKDYNWFRFPILLNSEKEKNKLVEVWKKNNILFWTTWSWINIVPNWIDLEKAKYKQWSCIIAENISKRILTLPNHKLITEKDTKKVVDLINKF